MNPVGFGVPPDEDVDEPCGVLGFLPHLVSDRPWLVGADVRHELVYGGEARLERLRLHLVTSEFVNLSGIPSNVGHADLLGVVAGLSDDMT